MKNLETMSLRFLDNQLTILDQQLLPDSETWVTIENPQVMISVIQKLKVRGAPLIGVSASLALAHWCPKAKGLSDFIETLEEVRKSRPTAVNLMNCLDRLKAVATESDFSVEAIQDKAVEMFDEDVALCEKMALAGASLVEPGDGVLTHCNTGGLATVGEGTALAVIKKAHRVGKDIHVYVDETRPLLQGGRLTTYELEKANVPYSLICDNMAGWFMQKGKIQKIFVGADRIAVNGDFANKIGTYSLAVLAKYHDIPFYVVAPRTTLDLECMDGEGIPVEMRKDSEVRGVHGHFGDVRWAPENAPVLNPAFDVAPCELATGFVIDDQILTAEQVKGGGLKDLKS